MKLEDQLVSLELAKELKSLGVKQDSLWYWCENQEGGERPITHDIYIKYVATNRVYNMPELKIYSAFTCSELGEMLPRQLTYHKSFDNTLWWVILPDALDPTSSIYKTSSTSEANARAKCLVWLIKNKHMEVQA